MFKRKTKAQKSAAAGNRIYRAGQKVGISWPVVAYWAHQSPGDVLPTLRTKEGRKLVFKGMSKEARREILRAARARKMRARMALGRKWLARKLGHRAKPRMPK